MKATMSKWQAIGCQTNVTVWAEDRREATWKVCDQLEAAALWNELDAFLTNGSLTEEIIS